ncbi:MAG: DUF2304 domain-containing protein [Chloroflexi bacterium]|nr:DUF2304 domain-containing protein [Chloroflexota bacterium]
MLDKFSLAILLSAVGVLVIVLELVRQRKLEEGYSLLWLAAGFLLVALPLSRRALDQVAGLFGVAYPPSVLFLVGFMAITLLLLYFSTVITRLNRQNREAAQRLGLLQWRIRELEKKLEEIADR